MDLVELTEFIIKSIVNDEEAVSVKEFDSEDDKLIKHYINNFYDRCRDKFTSIINSALKS